MVNGAALFHSRFDFSRHMHKILHLFVVTRIWRLVYLIFALCYGSVSAADLTPAKLITYFLGASIKGIPSGPLWFIRALIACYLIFPVLRLAFETEELRKYLRLLCAAMIVLMLLRQEILFWITGLTQSGILPEGTSLNLNFMDMYNPINVWALLYFILGGLLHQRYYVQKRSHSYQTCIVAFVIFLAASVWFYCIKGLISGFTGTAFNNFGAYGVDGGYQSLAVLVMAVCIFLIALNLPYTAEPLNRLWRLIGRNTLAIYYTHYMLAYLLRDYVPYFNAHLGIVSNLIKTVILTAIGLLFGLAMKKLPLASRLVS